MKGIKRMNKFILLLLMLNIVNVTWANDKKVKEPVADSVITTTINEVHPVVGQKITINYLLAVKSYFNGATRFNLPSLSKGRLVQASSFAVNGNTQIESAKYATQLWQIDFYPEHAGLIEIPSLAFKVQYIDIKGNKQVSTLHSESMAIFAYLPEPLKTIKTYIVTSDLELYEQWSEPKSVYQVGDIIQRDITIEASDINSIQIPHIKFEDIKGLQIHVQEAKLTDQNHRGEQTATLAQTITYVIKQPGKYQLGGEHLNWWSIEAGLQQTAFDKKEFHVIGISPLKIKAIIVITLIVLILLGLFFKWKKRSVTLQLQLKKALKNKQRTLFIALLYQKSDQNVNLGLLKTGKHEKIASQLLENNYQKQEKTAGSITLSTTTLKELIK